MSEEQARFQNAPSDLESDASAGESSDYTKQATSELIKGENVGCKQSESEMLEERWESLMESNRTNRQEHFTARVSARAKSAKLSCLEATRSEWHGQGSEAVIMGRIGHARTGSETRAS